MKVLTAIALWISFFPFWHMQDANKNEISILNADVWLTGLFASTICWYLASFMLPSEGNRLSCSTLFNVISLESHFKMEKNIPL